jgi:hypothetical protein
MAVVDIRLDCHSNRTLAHPGLRRVDPLLLSIAAVPWDRVGFRRLTMHSNAKLPGPGYPLTDVPPLGYTSATRLPGFAYAVIDPTCRFSPRHDCQVTAYKGKVRADTHRPSPAPLNTSELGCRDVAINGGA